jgi:hypothetical protein
MAEQDARSDDEPDYELLRRNGWAVNVACGRYCVAWKGHDEVVLVWGENGWRQVPGRGDLKAAA